MRRLLIVAAVTFLTAYVVVCVVMYTQQRKFLYFPPASKKPPVHRAGEPMVVYFHGNAMAAGEVEHIAAVLPGGFLAVEYPGYGTEPGAPTEDSIYEAAERQLKGLPKDVVLVGQSLGTGPAVELAKRGWGSKLVLLTPFTSVPDAAQRVMPWLPARWLVRDRFDSASKAPGITIPVLVVHGDQDEVIPYELGQQLAPMFPNGRLMTVSGGHHNDLWDRAEVVEAVRRFVEGTAPAVPAVPP